MKKLLTIISGIGFLIAMYLTLTNWSGTVNVINAIGRNTTAGIKTLQGRG